MIAAIFSPRPKTDDVIPAADSFQCDCCELGCIGKPYEITYFKPKTYTLKFCQPCYDEQEADDRRDEQKRREREPWMYEEGHHA